MRILLYNWASVLTNDGGGVNVYLKNIIKNIVKCGHCVSVLSSGVVYTNDNILRIEKEGDFIDGVPCYSIVNSPVVAPAYCMHNDMNIAIKNKNLNDLLFCFFKEHSFDIVHFNNIEGLSLDILDLRSKFKNIKFIYTFHNYHAVCPQVNLWKNEEENCLDNNNFEECISCFNTKGDVRYEIQKRSNSNQCLLKMKLFKYKIKVNRLFRYIGQSFLGECSDSNKKRIKKYIKEYVLESIDKINKNCDHLISVSARTKEIICSKGIRNDKHDVLYIGTKFASCSKIKKIANKKDYISISYIGYMRKDKGFYNLLWMLENISIDIAQKIDFTVAARSNKGSDLNRLHMLEKRLHSLHYHNGYTHETLPSILENVELGIVPVLWEDCLPQVAIELVCNGIPILTSDLGGAKELGNNRLFVYKATSIEDFESKLITFLEDKEKINEFWTTAMVPINIEDHTSSLTTIYCGESDRILK